MVTMIHFFFFSLYSSVNIISKFNLRNNRKDDKTNNFVIKVISFFFPYPLQFIPFRSINESFISFVSKNIYRIVIKEEMVKHGRNLRNWQRPETMVISGEVTSLTWPLVSTRSRSRAGFARKRKRFKFHLRQSRP